MVALLLSSSAAALLGLVSWLPPVISHNDHIADVAPGLFLPAEGSRGYVTLGRGVTASLYLSGLRILNHDDLRAETVVQGSPVSAVIGSVTGSGKRREEHVTRTLDNSRIDEVMVLPGMATYHGEVFDGEGHSLALTITVELRQEVVQLSVRVPGADAVVVHLDNRVRTVGYPPGLPHVNLRKRAWWVKTGTPGNTPLYTTALHSDIALGPVTPRAMDLRYSGRHDLRVWSDHADVTVALRHSVGHS